MPWNHSIEIDQDVTIKGNVEIQNSFNLPILGIDSDEQAIDITGDIRSVDSINTCGDITVGQNLVVTCSITTNGVIAGGKVSAQQINASGKIYAKGGVITGASITASGTINGAIICSSGDINAEGSITAESITSNCSINTGDINASGMITSGMIQANGDIIAANTTIRGSILSATESISLAGETISSWAELKGPAGPSIQRFTSPEVPANCSQFYFEGCNLVTGTELPFIQVRETATGKLVQMDVWVNLDGCCSGYTVGKPVANIQPCSTTTEAGAWTAIVMN